MDNQNGRPRPRMLHACALRFNRFVRNNLFICLKAELLQEPYEPTQVDFLVSSFGRSRGRRRGSFDVRDRCSTDLRKTDCRLGRTRTALRTTATEHAIAAGGV